MLKFFILLNIFCVSLLALDDIQNFSYGKINWSKKTVIVTGSGSPSISTKTESPFQARLNTEKFAKTDAYKNALEVIKGLKIKDNLSIEQELAKNKLNISNINKIIKSGKEKGKKYYDDGGVDIILEIPLSKILPLKNYKNNKNKKNLPVSGKEKKYTSIVINLLDFKYKKVLHPAIYDESNQIIYSVDVLEKEFSSIVYYFKNFEDAQELMGDSPLIINAKNLSPKNKSNIIISDIDSKKILNGKIDLSFLKNGRVIFITK